MGQDDQRQKKIQGFLDFFPLMQGKSAKKPAAEGPPEEIDQQARIIPLIAHAISNENPVKVTLPGEEAPFFTILMTNGGSMDHVEQASFLLVAPLDPPLGNIKIRRAASVHLNFFTDLFVAETKVRFEKLHASGSIQLSFPRTLTRGTQKRSSARIKVMAASRLLIMVQRPSGLTFTARGVDVSLGGICFYSQESTARIEADSKVLLTLEWPEGSPVQVQTMIMGITRKDGRATFRGRFLQLKDQRPLARLLEYLERVQAQHREKTFG